MSDIQGLLQICFMEDPKDLRQFCEKYTLTSQEFLKLMHSTWTGEMKTINHQVIVGKEAVSKLLIKAKGDSTEVENDSWKFEHAGINRNLDRISGGHLLTSETGQWTFFYFVNEAGKSSTQLHVLSSIFTSAPFTRIWENMENSQQEPSEATRIKYIEPKP